MNVRKMRQIGKDILAEPRRFNMSEWGRSIDGKWELRQIGHAVTAMPPCGTVCCFAGAWAIRYAKITPAELPDEIYTEGGKLADGLGWAASEDLNLPNDDLFYPFRWPAKLQRNFKAGTQKYAEHFVNVVLESYIRTNGWENGRV